MDAAFYVWVATAIVGPFLSLFVFGLLGWLVGAGIEAVTRSQLICAVAVALGTMAVLVSAYVVTNSTAFSYWPYGSYTGAVMGLAIVLPGSIGFCIGGISGATDRS